MDFKEFVKEVSEKIRDFLPDWLKDAEIKINEVTKNNGLKLTGLTIRNEDSNISPTIYLESFYERFKEGAMNLGEVMQAIANTRAEHEPSHDFNVGYLTDIDSIRDRITCKLVNRDLNTEFLENRPYTVVEDLAIVYMVDLGNNGSGRMTAGITDSLMETYGITKEELHNIAMDNLSRADISFRSMWDVLSELNPVMFSPDNEEMRAEVEPSPMHILTIRDTTFGAAAVLDTATMDDIAQKLGGDYVVIPSSVSEVIIVPINPEMTMSNRQLNEMVHEVNETELAVEDRLSDHVYMYDAKEHELVSAAHYEERQAERASEKTADREVVKDAMSSVKDKLADKSAEVAKKEAVREKPAKVRDTAVRS